MIQHFNDFMTQHCGLLPWKAVNETGIRNVGQKLHFYHEKLTYWAKIYNFSNSNGENSIKIGHFPSENYALFRPNIAFYQDFTILVPDPKLKYNCGSPWDRSCRIIKRNLTNIQDFVLLILLFQIVIVTLHLFWETFTH